VGNTMAVTDGSGAVKNAYAYTPYGRVTNKQEAKAQPFQFAGQFGVMTETNGLLYMRARYYDSKLGRFLSEDPSGFDGGLNLYAYVGGNPISLADPSGLFVQSIVAGGVAGVTVGGISFVTDIAKGASYSDAGKNAVINGGTAAVGVGLASTGAGFLVANTAATATNAALQAAFNGKIDILTALSSFATTAGGFASGSALAELSKTSFRGAAASGLASGLIASPLTVGGNAIPCGN